jgi:hypothetical protein
MHYVHVPIYPQAFFMLKLNFISFINTPLPQLIKNTYVLIKKCVHIPDKEEPPKNELKHKARDDEHIVCPRCGGKIK